MKNILDSNLLEYLTQEFTSIVENLWSKYSKKANIMKCLKSWQIEKCNRDLVIYHTFRKKKDWINYKKTMRIVKHVFFDNRIQEITSTNKRP